MNTVQKELQTIPGIGKSIAADLINIGILNVKSLQYKNPYLLYRKIEIFYGLKQDPCLLYVMRCAVYFASTKVHDEEKLKWWYWKDQTIYESPISAQQKLGKSLRIPAVK
ncbi:MAG: pathogenicity locus [Chitinophagales bacterium]|nr:pathogenicity locus [Chitinophagales bacterium]